MKNKTIVLTGGGSGGHVIPILALLPEIKENFDKIYFVGGSGIEKTLVKDAGVFYHEIHTVGLDRAHVFKNLKIPFVLFNAVREQKRVFLREIHPDVVFSKGGFISLPTVLAARKLKIPCVAHESDLSLGIANRIAGKKRRDDFDGF
ncbi:MAG: glycosyltransferase [Clostridiales bacterium]|nr:MAG: glycosyltransferase [Clostridiales bacterium]